MAEVEFTFSPRRDVEEPLYLDSARSRAPNSRPAEGVLDPAPAADRPLHLDLAREPRRKRRGVPLVLACALTFLLGAGAGVLFLQPPSVLRDTFATVLASATTSDAKTTIQAAPVGTEPAHEQGATSAAQLEAAPASTSPLAPSAVPDSPPALEPPAEPPAKPQAAASKPRPRRAVAPKKHAAEAKSVRTHSKAKAPLDLDALEKSLR